MPKENRFSGLMGQVGKAKKSDQSAPKPSSTSPVKSKSDDYTKLTVYITKALHKRLKVGGAQLEMELSDIAEAAIDEYLSKRLDG